MDSFKPINVDINKSQMYTQSEETAKELNLLAWINTATNIMKTFNLFVSILIYEDRNQRRWVEYNDYLSVRSPNGDMIPPKWHGWLAHQYDDVPLPESPSFHDPFFERPH